MSVSYLVKEGFSGFNRARLAAVTSISALIVSVLLTGLLLRIGFNAYELAQSIRAMVEVELFIHQEEQLDVRSMQRFLEKEPGVASVGFISKDSAQAIFMKDFGGEGAALASLDFLPASFRVSFEDDASIEMMRSLVAIYKDHPAIEEVVFNEELLNVLESRLRTLGLIGLSIAGVIILASLLLVYNTIRLTIYAKEPIIKAMKMVGATDTFIRRPFLVEGMVQGMIAGLFSVGGLFLIFHTLIPKVLPQVGVLTWPFGRWYFLTGFLVLFGIILGYLGSRWAARKFIKSVQIGQS